MQKVFLKHWPFVLIFVAVLIFFYPVIFQNKIALPADIIVGVSYPWYTPFPVKNPILSDAVSFTYPMRTTAVDILKKGEIPLWNPYILMGTPLLANFQSAPFSITNIFYFLLPTLDGWNFQIISQIILAAIFMYLFLRELNLNKFCSLSGSLFFAFSGFMMIWLEWNTHDLVAAFFPLIFYLHLRYLKTRKIICGVLISISLAFQIFAGYPQIIIYQYFGLGLLLILNKENLNFLKVLSLILFNVLGFGLASLQTLPAAELLALSQRKSEIIPDQWTYLPWQLLITFIAPDYFGNHSTYNYWGPANYTLNTGYSGIIVFMLSFFGLKNFFKNSNIKFALGLIALSLVIALPNPISFFIKESGFLGLQAGTFHRGLVLSNLGFAILASFGLSELLKNKSQIRNNLRIIFIPILIFLILFFVTYLGKINSKNSEDLIHFTIALRNLVLPGVFLGVSAVLVISSLKFKFRKYILIMLLVLSLFELFRFGWKFNSFSPKETVFPKNSVLSFLQSQEKSFRVLAQPVIPTNFLMMYGLETIEGYDAVYPYTTAKYLAVLNSNNSQNSAQDRYGAVSNLDSNLLNLANVNYVLQKSENVNSSAHLQEVFKDNSVIILENKKVMPRVFITQDWEIDKDETSILQKLVDKNINPNKIFLEEDLELNPSKNSDENFINTNGNNIEFNTNQSGLLFIGNTFYPGWKAKLDGIDTKILRANYNFMAIPIQAPGFHKLTLIYYPESFHKGLILSLISLLILIILIAVEKVLKNVKNTIRNS